MPEKLLIHPIGLHLFKNTVLNEVEVSFLKVKKQEATGSFYSGQSSIAANNPPPLPPPSPTSPKKKKCTKMKNGLNDSQEDLTFDAGTIFKNIIKRLCKFDNLILMVLHRYFSRYFYDHNFLPKSISFSVALS